MLVLCLKMSGWKEVKWCVDYRLKNAAFYESQLGSTRTVLLKAKIKRVTFMVLLKTKVKPVELELVNTLHEINWLQLILMVVSEWSLLQLRYKHFKIIKV
jgi:hypothetical protein